MGVSIVNDIQWISLCAEHLQMVPLDMAFFLFFKHTYMQCK